MRSRGDALVSYWRILQHDTMDRRQFLVTGFGAMVGVAVFPVSLRAQSGRVTVLAANGTNVVSFRSGDALVLVDGAAPELARSVTVFNTHYHPENTAANEQLRAAGADIIAHVNTKLWMSTPIWIPA